MPVCNLCNKLFPTPSKLYAHKNRKNPCNAPKTDLNCNLCNVEFKCIYDKLRHENTNKHLNNFLNNKNDSNDLKNKDNKILDNKNKELKDKIFELENKMINLEVNNNNLNNKMINLEIENQNTVNELNTRIKHLEVENINLKNNQKLHPDYESIYIIHSAQHVNTNIYKIGRTENINARRVNYPSGSDLLYSFSCKDAKTVENTILDYLKINKETFKLMDFGREYFQCNLKDLRNAVLKFID
jgi:hypothetical protein